MAGGVLSAIYCSNDMEEVGRYSGVGNGDGVLSAIGGVTAAEDWSCGSVDENDKVLVREVCGVGVRMSHGGEAGCSVDYGAPEVGARRVAQVVDGGGYQSMGVTIGVLGVWAIGCLGRLVSGVRWVRNAAWYWGAAEEGGEWGGECGDNGGGNCSWRGW